LEVCQSPVYWNSLENCRLERVRGFESHRFHQYRRVGRVVMHRIANPPFRKRRTGSSPVLSAIFKKEKEMDASEYWKWIRDNVQ
jgi:hypothetical protein